MRVCVDCGSDNVHSIEFRMDYSNARSLYPINDNTDEISNDDLPSYLGGDYCHNCKGFCSTIEKV